MKILRRILKFFLWTLLTAVVVLAAAVAFLPSILPLVTFPEQTFDLAPHMTAEHRALVENATASADFDFHRSRTQDIALRAHGRLLDWTYTLRAGFDYSLWDRSAEGSFSLGFDGTPWRASGRFGGSAKKGWRRDASMDPVAFDESDPLLGALLKRAVAPAVTNLAVSGSIGFKASFNTTNSLAVPSWKVVAAVSGVSAALTAAENDVEIEGLRLRLGASGYGEQVEISPMFPRADAVTVSGVTLTNVFASIRATEKSLLVTEAGADVYGGQVRLYALFLSPERLDAGVTMFLDDIDTGMVLNRISGFQGSATGRLHGKLPLKLRNGTRLSLGDGYLYSIPGETGTVRLDDPGPVLENLAAGGVDQASLDNLSKVLKSLTYSALNLERSEERPSG